MKSVDISTGNSRGDQRHTSKMVLMYYRVIQITLKCVMLSTTLALPTIKIHLQQKTKSLTTYIGFNMSTSLGFRV